MAVLTISRQVGSWGDQIAELVARNMGLELITTERLQKMGQECDQDFAKACNLFVEEVPQSFWDRVFFSNPAHRALFESLNLDLALKGDVLMIGRGAQVALAGLPGVLKIRLVAPFEVRVERIRKERNIDYAEAESFASWYGKRRRNLVESVFHVDLSDSELYDSVINTRDFDVQGVAEIIQCTAEQRMRNLNQEELKQKLELLSIAKKIEISIMKKLGNSLLRNVQVEAAAGGEITLSGFVQDTGAKDKVTELVQKYEGVTSLNNQIVVIGDLER